MMRSASSLRPVSMMMGMSRESRSRRAIARPSASGSFRSRTTRSITSAPRTLSMSAPEAASETCRSCATRYSRTSSRMATSSSTTRIWAASILFSVFMKGRRKGHFNAGARTIRSAVRINAPTPSAVALGNAISARQTLAFIAFGVVYYLLAEYAARLPIEPRLPLLIWPAHGLALGTLLVAPVRRWPAYLLLVIVATLAIGLDLGAPWQRIASTMAVNAAEPLFVAAGLLRLAGPRVQIDSIRAVTSFLVGMAPLVAAMAILDAGFTYLHTDAPYRQHWSVTFVSTMIGMLLTAPLILAWSRHGWREALGVARSRLPELIFLYGGLVLTTNYVFGMRPSAAGYIPPLIYLSAPFLIWAALRFGLRAATLALATFGLI